MNVSKTKLVLFLEKLESLFRGYCLDSGNKFRRQLSGMLDAGGYLGVFLSTYHSSFIADLAYDIRQELRNRPASQRKISKDMAKRYDTLVKYVLSPSAKRELGILEEGNEVIEDPNT